MTPAKYILGIVSNPYPTVYLVEATDEGKPVMRKMKKWTGKWKDGKAVYGGHEMKMATQNPRSHGGIYWTRSVRIVDTTPRSYDEAMAIALTYEAGNHISLPAWWNTLVK